MHDIEPYYKWRDYYQAEFDSKSPFYGRQYSEFTFSNKVYNYFIHPQWDDMGSKTLYIKILYTDYDQSFAAMELIGEWNDLLYNDVMYLKRQIVDALALNGICKYVVLCDHVLNFHADDNCYYEEWYEDVMEENGWIVFLNLLKHVEEEMRQEQVSDYVYLGGNLNEVNWRRLKPQALLQLCQGMIDER